MSKQTNKEAEVSGAEIVQQAFGLGKDFQEMLSEAIKKMEEIRADAKELVAKADASAEESRQTLEANLRKAAKTAIANAGEVDRKEAEDFYNRSLKEYEKARTATRELLADVEAKKKEVQDIIVRNAHLDESGCTTIDGTGTCYVYLSEDFIAAAGGRPYQVFLQEEAEGKLYVSKKMDSAFLVEGTPDIPFSWNARVSVQ